MKNMPKPGTPLGFTLVNPLAAAIIVIIGLISLPESPVNGQSSTVLGIPLKSVNSIVVDNENMKWFSTDVGIVSYNGENWKLHDGNKNLPTRHLKSVSYVDHPEGPELWIASPNGATVARLPMDDQTDVITYHPENAPILSENVVSIASGENSIRWIGTGRGVSALSSDTWLTPDYDMYYPERLFEIYPITSMATNPKGDSLYVGTVGAGVARVYRDNVDGISGASVYAQWGPIMLPSDNIRSIYIAPDGTKWFGTEEGVARHTGDNTLDNWTVFTTEDGLVDNFIQAIGGTQKGDIWFGTKAGISVFNGSVWISYTTDNGLASNNILSIAADNDGIVWIGTDAGISSYENGEFINYTGFPTSDKKIKVPVYAWMGGPKDATDQEIKANFMDLKNKGIIGLMYNGGHDPETYKRVGGIAKEVGLEFHPWIPAMIQGKNPKLAPELYAINGVGESAFEKPAYADHYKFLCPSREEVYQFLAELYGSIADLPEVDGIHLDYIRYPDVILGEGLWAKYDLVMDREYPQFDYCYCDHCVNGFKEKTGIDIRSVEDPSQVEEWKQYRYDLITKIVNRLAELVHAKGKEINAAVFPGPNSIARKTVRQEWDKWNVDAFYPMNYNDFYLKGTNWIGEVTHEGVTALNNRNPVRAYDSNPSGAQVSKPLYSGLFICPRPENKANEPDPEGHGLLPEELEDAIRESMENGAAGVCLFTPGRMTDEHWKVFETAIRKDFTKK